MIKDEVPELVCEAEESAHRRVISVETDHALSAQQDPARPGRPVSFKYVKSGPSDDLFQRSGRSRDPVVL